MYPKNLSDITDPYVRNRIAIERHIVRALIDHLLEQGYELRVDQGAINDPDTCTDAYTDALAVLDALMECDEDRLFLERDGLAAGWVFLVYGNSGWDVISDYTTNLTDVLDPITKLALSLED